MKQTIFWLVIGIIVIVLAWLLYKAFNSSAPAEGSLCNNGFGRITNGVCVGCGTYRTATPGPPIPRPC